MVMRKRFDFQKSEIVRLIDLGNSSYKIALIRIRSTINQFRK